MDFHFSKEQLLAALEARRPWATALDKKQMRDHAAAEKATLAKFKERCREALKWDYDTFKKNGYEIEVRWSDRPECPSPVLQTLDSVIKFVTQDGRKRYTVTPKGPLSKAHYLLTYDENARPDVCK